MSENNGWGGTRKNSGRKKKAKEDKLISVNFQLTRESIIFIDSCEGKSRSAKLRHILEEYSNLKK